MECIHCGGVTRFDRILVMLAEREEVGCLCESCEELCGELFDMTVADSSGCWLCEQAGVYALPKWNVAAWEEDEEALCWLEYEIQSEAPIVCEEHFEILADGGLAAHERADRVVTPERPPRVRRD